jgi:hypothetical protein
MTVMPNHALSTPFQLLSAFVVAVLIPACALPDSAMQNYAGASRLNQWNGVLDALGGSSVRRAESSGNRPLYNGAASMNVPTSSSSINDIASSVPLYAIKSLISSCPYSISLTRSKSTSLPSCDK